MDWKLGTASVSAGDHVVVLDLFEQRRLHALGARCIRFDDVLGAASVARGDRVLVDVPTWRGHTFIELLEWLVCARLSEPGRTLVTWTTDKRRGATGLRRTLEARGWTVDETRSRSSRVFEGVAPAPPAPPEPRSFEAELAGVTLRFAADWGVFSRDHIDAGTRLLFDVASREIERGSRPLPNVVDVGVGYGAIAIGLQAAGLCERSIGSEVDFVATHLARHNAATAGVSLDLVAEDDPVKLAPAPLTVCEVPTHASSDVTGTLVNGLAARSAHGLVLLAVHARLGARYAKLLSAAGGEPDTIAGGSHALLRLGALPALR